HNCQEYQNGAPANAYDGYNPLDSGDDNLPIGPRIEESIRVARGGPCHGHLRAGWPIERFVKNRDGVPCRGELSGVERLPLSANADGDGFDSVEHFRGCRDV